MEETKREFAGWRLLLGAVGIMAIVAAPIALTETGVLKTAEGWLTSLGRAIPERLRAGADWVDTKADDLARRSGREDLTRGSSAGR